MPRDVPSLLAGRNAQPLSDEDRKRVANTCLGLDPRAPFVVREGERTRFRLTPEEGLPEIVFGEDVYPGIGVVDPNSSLGMLAAVAHELSHYYRWVDMTELSVPALEHLDEAFTSLDAILRFYQHLTDNDRQNLIRDAIQRIQMHIHRGGA